MERGIPASGMEHCINGNLIFICKLLPIRNIMKPFINK